MFEQYLENVRKVLRQYDEGAIFAEEGFNKIASDTIELSQTPEYMEKYKEYIADTGIGTQESK